MSESRQTEILEQALPPLVELSKTTEPTFGIKELLTEAVMLLRKIEYHLAIASDTNINDYEIKGA